MLVLQRFVCLSVCRLLFSTRRTVEIGDLSLTYNLPS